MAHLDGVGGGVEVVEGADAEAGGGPELGLGDGFCDGDRRAVEDDLGLVRSDGREVVEGFGGGEGSARGSLGIQNR